MTNLKNLRKQRGLTVNEVARVLNVSQSAISQYESGKREPDFATLVLLADLLNTSTDYLLGRANEVPGNVYEILNSIVDIGCHGERTVHTPNKDLLAVVRMLLVIFDKLQ